MVELTHEEYIKNENTRKRLRIYNIICTIIIASMIAIGVGFGVKSNLTKDYQNKEYVTSVYSSNMYNNYIRSKANLIDSINKYIIIIAPESALNGSVILEECDGTCVDIKFVLAQGHLESHFETKGLASRTNSVFNVWACDGLSESCISNKGKYKHPDFSVKPYIELLKRKYLVDGKTEMDLLDNFINTNGERYASNPNYEKQLLDIYTKMNNVVNIDKAYQEYNKYKILSGI